MITERSIINVLIVIAVLIIMPFLISSALIEFDYIGLGLLLALFGLILGFFLIKDKLAFAPLLAASYQGALPFMPVNVTLTDLMSLILVLYYITGYILIRQKPIRLGLQRLLWPILIITGIMLYHNHELSLHIFGGDTEGARTIYLCYLTILAYFAGINIGPLPSTFVSRLPIIAVTIACIGAIPFLITTIAPSTAPYVAAVSSQVNAEAYFASKGAASEEEPARIPILSMVAVPIITCLLSYYPVGTWLRPERWWILFLGLLCAYGTMQAGYRSTFFVFCVMILAGAWCYYAWRSLAIPTLAAVVMLVVVAASMNNLIAIPVSKFPKLVQRTLSFLPGDWDPEIVATARSSSAFREHIIDVYEKEYMWKSPWLGNGRTIDIARFEEYGRALETAPSQDEADYDQAKLFIEGKMFHTGWISVYDHVGIIGTSVFIFFHLALLYTLAEWIFEAKVDRRSSLFPCYVWMFVNISAGLVGFFTVFGDFIPSFQNLLLYSIVVSHIAGLRKVGDVPVVRGEVESGGDTNRPGARYGYGYPSRY